MEIRGLLPKGFYFQNFIDAWNTAKMGDYMLNSVLVTALALVILLMLHCRQLTVCHVLNLKEANL